MRREALILVILFLLSFALRWYRLPEHLYFGFEQGRDAIIIRDIAHLKDFQLVGPKTDITGVFHGAWYYYFMVIPFLLVGGNPLGLAAFQVFLSSLTVLLIYAGVRSVTSSKSYGLVAALIAAQSYEQILFARWLSNVSPAMLLVPLGMFLLWRYKTSRSLRDWCLAAFSLLFAAQFEIALFISLPFLFFLLVVTKLIPFPRWKEIGVSIGVALLLLSPMALFNMRNANIIGNTVVGYLQGKTDHKRELDLARSVKLYANEQKVAVMRNLFNRSRSDNLGISIFMLLFLGGLILDWKEKQNRVQLHFFLVWILATLPLLFFTENVQATQVYVGFGIGYIGLATLAIRGYWQQKEYAVYLIPFIIAILMGFTQTVIRLHRNEDVFYRTIQDDLNYKDQRAALFWIHEDARGQDYRFDAYTIPYYQPHAWVYLKTLWFPSDKADRAQIMYIVIEKNVDPHWEKTWIENIGQTTPIEERTFGKIRVKKLQVQ